MIVIRHICSFLLAHHTNQMLVDARIHDRREDADRRIVAENRRVTPAENRRQAFVKLLPAAARTTRDVDRSKAVSSSSASLAINDDKRCS